MFKKKVHNWGLFPKINANVIEPKNYEKEISEIINSDSIIARGNGRCYGDSALQNTIFSTLKMKKFIFFDSEKGTLKCESGVLLSEILNLIVPKGYFLPVTPGTKFITVGGAVASNIHGKNHHKDGAFSKYIIDFEILLHNGQIVKCSKTENTSIFTNTIGGMGLTGLITTVCLSLKKIETSYIKQKSIKASNLDQIIDYLDAYKDYTYSVAWINCLSKGKSIGKSILMLGEHAKKNEIGTKNKVLQPHSSKQINIPFHFPSLTLNKYTVRAFNWFYYNKQIQKETNTIVHYNSFFYPLDSLNNWNRIYGKKGFTQYQFVIPFENGKEGLHKILKEISNSGCGSFLAVLKTFGAKDEYSSSLSFPMKGYTLALDFKINTKVLTLLNKLDNLVLQYGGKLYLAKDSRMSKDMFSRTYSKQIKSNKFISLQHERLSE